MLVSIAILSFGASLLLCIYALPIGRALAILDVPDSHRKLHGRITPMVGGIACLAPTLVFGGLLGSIGTDLATDDGRPEVVLGLALSTAALFLMGYLDDCRDVAPAVRLAGIAMVVGLCAALVDGALITELRPVSGPTLSLGSFAYPLTVLVLVGFVVAMNMADGVNGLTPGLFMIWTAALAVQPDAGLRPLSLALLASMAVVLVYNLRGRLFMGDSGIYGVAGLIGFLAVEAEGPPPTSGLSGETMAAWFAVPMIDCLRVAAVRIQHGISPFTADRRHFHHLLIACCGPPRAVLIYLTLVGSSVAATIVAPASSLLWLAAEVVAYGAVTAMLTARANRLQGSSDPVA